MSTTPTKAEDAVTIIERSTYNQDQKEAILEGGQATHNPPLLSVTYRHSAVQALPPANAHQFRIIYGRGPTDREIVTKVGAAAIGRYSGGFTPEPYDTITQPPFIVTKSRENESTCHDSSFQTCSMAQCKISLARAKAKASVLVSKQRNAAQDAGYNIWVEENEDMIAHAEQQVIRIKFDDLGNAANAEVDGLSLPNICGEKIHPSENDRALTMDYTAIPDPPPPPLTENEGDGLHLRSLEAIEPASPETDLDPWALEDYGYIRKTSPEEDDGFWGQGKIGTELEIGGPRFADQFVVYDPTQDLSRVPPTASLTAPAKLRKEAGKVEPRTSIYRQHEEHSKEHQNTPDQLQGTEKATPGPKKSRGRTFSTKGRGGLERTTSREYSRRNARSYRNFTPERSRSPVQRQDRTSYRTRCPASSVNTSAWNVREDTFHDRQEEARRDARRAQQTEEKRRWTQERDERHRRQEETEIERAREAKNCFRQEMEESRRMRDVKRIAQDATTTPRYPRNISLRRKGSTDNDRHTDNQEPSAEVDQYALAREAEDHRRELASAQLSSDIRLLSTRNRSPHTARQTDREPNSRRRPEKKVEDDRVTKTRGKRGPRRELEWYDPRKKFGPGR